MEPMVVNTVSKTIESVENSRANKESSNLNESFLQEWNSKKDENAISKRSKEYFVVTLCITKFDNQR